VTSFETVAYATHAAADLSLDVFPPTAASRRCAVLVLHGGAWRMEAKEAVRDRATALAAQGFTALAVQYRLLGAAPWPAALADATAALAWARANAARLGVDPGQVVVQGHSAGGHIALLTGTLSRAERPAAIAAYYPAIGFYRAAPPADPSVLAAEADDLGRLPSWVLLPPEASQADLDAASPITLAAPGFPPTILLHGTADRALNARSSLALHQRLLELGVPSDLHLFAGRDHEFDRAPSLTAATAATVASFLARFVTDKEASDAEALRFPFPPAPPG
jgi:acetyl esterase/lipase